MVQVIAAKIRNGTLPDLMSQSATSSFGCQASFSFISCSMADAQAEAIELIESIGGPGDTQILSAIKNDPAGIKVINTALHHLRATGKDTWEGFAVDDPVIYLENDYDRRIWNGTLGVVQAAGPTNLSVLWDGHDRSITMDRGDLENMDLAYAISVHKAHPEEPVHQINLGAHPKN